MKYLSPRCFIGLPGITLAVSNAWTHSGHNHGQAHRGAPVGVAIGVPQAGAWHSPYYVLLAYPYAHFHPPVNTPAVPARVERDSATLAMERQPDYGRFYCPNAAVDYPYVQQCPQGWQPVTPYPHLE